MDCFLLQHHQQFFSPNFMLNPLNSKTLFTKSLKFLPLPFCTVSLHVNTPIEVKQSPNGKPRSNSKEKIKFIKENWLSSLSYNGLKCSKDDAEGSNGELKWVIGVDPDVSGALAVLKSDVSCNTSAEVFDSPFVQVAVGKRLRKRLDARSVFQLVQSIDAPRGTIAYLEQSIPFPRDGKQGWWSGGFGYGLWIGILVASGFCVVPVPSSVWKRELELVRGRANKDDSRELARQLYPSLSSMLKRKKDHGRAEALLIATYGKGHKIKSDMLEKIDPESCEAANETVIDETDQPLSICH